MNILIRFTRDVVVPPLVFHCVQLHCTCTCMSVILLIFGACMKKANGMYVHVQNLCTCTCTCIRILAVYDGSAGAVSFKADHICGRPAQGGSAAGAGGVCLPGLCQVHDL